MQEIQQLVQKESKPINGQTKRTIYKDETKTKKGSIGNIKKLNREYKACKIIQHYHTKKNFK